MNPFFFSVVEERWYQAWLVAHNRVLSLSLFLPDQIRFLQENKAYWLLEKNWIPSWDPGYRTLIISNRY